jgi:hypothetical protein
MSENTEDVQEKAVKFDKSTANESNNRRSLFLGGLSGAFYRLGEI